MMQLRSPCALRRGHTLPSIVARDTFFRFAERRHSMPEATSNVEFARTIHEHGQHHPPPTDRRSQWIEIAEAVVLADCRGRHRLERLPGSEVGCPLGTGL